MKLSMTKILDNNRALTKTRPEQAQPTLQPLILFGIREILKTSYMRLKTTGSQLSTVSKDAVLLPYLTPFIVQQPKVGKKNGFKLPVN